MPIRGAKLVWSGPLESRSNPRLSLRRRAVQRIGRRPQEFRRISSRLRIAHREYISYLVIVGVSRLVEFITQPEVYGQLGRYAPVILRIICPGAISGDAPWLARACRMAVGAPSSMLAKAVPEFETDDKEVSVVVKSALPFIGLVVLVKNWRQLSCAELQRGRLAHLGKSYLWPGRRGLPCRCRRWEC